MQLTRLLAHPLAYRLWQSPFADAKIEPLFRHNDISRVTTVLDVGCGPGTNAAHFGHADYTGVDINPAYVAYARSRFRGRFRCADATTMEADVGRRYDLVLVNSLLHHVDDQPGRALLAALSGMVAPGGHIHVIDLVLPDTCGLARMLAVQDRGDFARPTHVLQRMLTERYRATVFEPFAIDVLGLRLWNLVYFKGEPIR